ncbi:MAG: 2-hydroxyacyl-CoA dehydratase [Planctomycetota bacterium]|jgi:benzoyl-CoA reductase/2-hydroxyglutaryl-CoA dehydratase subunit BcrC/BadD/HgdB
MTEPAKITLEQWDLRYQQLCNSGLHQTSYGGPISRYLNDGDFRLQKLNRLRHAKIQGKKIVGTMKDLGTVPVMAYSLDNVVAFYPDGAWWTPCIMELSAGLLNIADSLGIDESFCPVRALLGAFVNGKHFPVPDLLTCSAGAVCDDFSVVAQRLEQMGHQILWWEIPHRRVPENNEKAVFLSNGFSCPQVQVDFVMTQLEHIKIALQVLSQQDLEDEKLAEGIRKANKVRRLLSELRDLVYASDPPPLPALEMQIAEMLAVHYCSDRQQTIEVLQDLLEEVKKRIDDQKGVLPSGLARIFWVNPVADLQVMNLLEDCGARICGTEFLFPHAIDLIPEDVAPLEALAQMALADPMTGSSLDRARNINSQIKKYDAEAVVISRIPGASHCALEGKIISDYIQNINNLPVLEIEVPPITDSIQPTLKNRFQALVETIIERRNK